MSSDIVMQVENLSKYYQIYNHPRDRLKQFVLPRFSRLAGRPFRNYFQEFRALEDVSFEVRKGETLGIIGKNGSGKSTLLQMICGTLTPSGGLVKTHGRIAALLELGSGFNPEFTGRENVYMNASILGLSNQEINKRFEDIAAFADIGEFIDRPVKMYSSGMYVRLAFSVAINATPDVLVVDEALAVGDVAFQRKCYARIEEIKKKGCSILLVTHDMQTVVSLCDRAIFLAEGKKILDGEPKPVCDAYHRVLFCTDPTEAKMILQSVQGIKQKEEPSDNTPDKAMVQRSPHYEPGLLSNPVYYASRGAEIISPQITTLSGKNVNVLLKGETYFFSYSVRFSSAFSSVYFAASFKEISGVELFCPRTLDYHIKEGTIAIVRFPFHCLFNSENYFVNAGVWDITSEAPLHRVIDALAFKIFPEEGVKFGGYVDFYDYSCNFLEDAVIFSEV